MLVNRPQKSRVKIYQKPLVVPIWYSLPEEWGGTGTGAAPVAALCARELGALTIAVVTKPFSFEGKVRMKNALEGIEKLKGNVDAILVVSNDKLLQIFDKKHH